MRALGNVLWHFPFFGFVSAALYWLVGLLLTVTVVAAPIGVGCMEYGKYLLAPFNFAMVNKTELNIEQHPYWKRYSTIVTILYLPLGAILMLVSVIQVIALCITIVGIPVALVVAKSLGTILNPVNKKCVHRAVVDELERRKARAQVDKYLDTE